MSNDSKDSKEPPMTGNDVTVCPVGGHHKTHDPHPFIVVDGEDLQGNYTLFGGFRCVLCASMYLVSVDPKYKRKFHDMSIEVPGNKPVKN